MGRLAWFGAPAILGVIGLAPLTALSLGAGAAIGATALTGYMLGKKKRKK